ncbi:MAG: hypothetical protein EPO35_02740 [Acidobacteria bacterium]|nr:MAG: hypothetical protein EPO35_02740 [Acidobacteriota bacterium]
MRLLNLSMLTLTFATLSACGTAQAPGGTPGGGTDPEAAALLKKIQQFAPTEITADISGLPANERQALARMIEAAQLFDGLFLQQAWADNPAMLARLSADDSPVGRARLHYFLINKGPWDRVDHHKPFVPGAPAKPEMGNYYPADSTKAEIEQWIASLPAAKKADATGFFSVVRRGADGKLMTVPYSVEYQNTLTAASKLLNEAAALTANASLKKFLSLRATALVTNDYFASDMAWMELDAAIEPTIGPYETYEDEWFGYKAGFEAFIALRDENETRKLQAFGAELQGLEDALPIDPAFRSPKLGGLAPIRVVNSVFASGDGNRGVQTAAYNLPNDDRVIKEKGSKRVMLRNVQAAKFDKCLVPISKIALAAGDQGKISFDAFFTHIVMHEVMHGLGPHQVLAPAAGSAAAKGAAVRTALTDTYAALEEAKADISGLWALQQLADKGVVSKDIAGTMYTTFLASTFRSIRFGLSEAHGKGVALQLNYLLDKGGFTVNADGTFAVNDAKIKDAVAGLTREIMHLQATGDYAGAKALLASMVTVRPEVQKVLDKLTGVPIDIEPKFTTIK